MNFKTRIVEVAIWGAVLVFCLLVCISKCRADDGKLEHDRIEVIKSEYVEVKYESPGYRNTTDFVCVWTKDVDTQKKYMVFLRGAEGIEVVEDNSQIENSIETLKSRVDNYLRSH